MKKLNLMALILCLTLHFTTFAQDNSRKIKITADNFSIYNRKATYDKGTVHLNAAKNDGMLWLNGVDFKNGVIEFDMRGKNAPGQSFVGLAFHGQDNKKFDAVYFRPFNFKNPSRNDHAVQYVNMPKNGWSALRNAFPGKYESTINPLPNDEEDWFHVRIAINHPNVKVYINNAEENTLDIDQISTIGHGKIGFWVGNGSEGWFKNLSISNE